MPSKTSERFMRADRKNRIENVRLLQVKRLYDRSKTSLALDIEREQRQLAKSFEGVKRTSGFSDQGVPPKNENDKDYENSPNYRMGQRLSEMRLLEWKNSEKQLNRFLSQSDLEMEKNKKWRRHSTPDMNGNYISRRSSSAKATNSSSSCSMETENTGKNVEDSVFEDENLNSQIEQFTLDAEKLEKEITEGYKALFKNTNVKINRYSVNLNRKALSTSDADDIAKKKQIRFRPHTASVVSENRRKISTQSLPPRPATAHSTEAPYVQSFIIAKDGAYIHTGKNYRKIHLEIQQNKNSPKIYDYSNEEMESTNLPTVGESNEEIFDDSSPLEQNENQNFMTMILEEENEESIVKHNKTLSERSLSENSFKEISQNDTSNISKRRLAMMQKERKRNISASSGSDFEPFSPRVGNDDTSSHENFSYMSRLVSARQRFGSTSTLLSDQGYSLTSDIFGSTSDMSSSSEGQKRQSRWRQFIAANKVQLPNPKKFSSVGAVVRAAMAFSKSARKKALDKLVEEQSADSRELIRQERLRRLESRNNVLSTIASQWGLNPEVNSVKEVSEES